MPLLAELARMVAALPPGTQLGIPADWLRAAIEEEQGREEPAPEVSAAAVDPAPTWREKLWTCPAETRIGPAELCEAVGRPRSWLYRHTSGKTIPFRKFDGELVFVVGELRAWLREREDVVHAGPMESTHLERSGWAIVPGGKAASR